MRASVVTSCDASPILELCKEVLDFVALAVKRLVIGIRHLTASAGRDAGCNAFLLQGLPEKRNDTR